jgi:phosphatidylglycerophosphate synthase
MISGGSDTVVVVVTVVMVCWVAGPNEIWAMVECGGSIVVVVVMSSMASARERRMGMSSAGEAGAVERIGSDVYEG